MRTTAVLVAMLGLMAVLAACTSTSSDDGKRFTGVYGGIQGGTAIGR